MSGFRPIAVLRSVPSITAATTAGILFVILAMLGSDAVQRAVQARMDQLAPQLSDQKNLGTVIQSEAFRRDDILPVYGTSELVRPVANRASDFFATFPTGFAVSPVGDRATPVLVTFQQLAAVGDALRGHKVAIILTPDMFTRPPKAREADAFAGNFSRQQAGEVMFGDALTPALRRRAAEQLLRYPGVLEGDPFLRAAVDAVASDDVAGAVGYRLLRPFGRMQNVVLRWAEDVGLAGLMLAVPSLADPAERRPAPVDWRAREAQAEATYRRQAADHAFGFELPIWNVGGDRYLSVQSSRSDAEFLNTMASSPRWAALDMTLELLREHGAEALVMSIPFHGPYVDFVGVSAAARHQYYARLKAEASAHGARVETFEEREYEPLYLLDPVHPSPKGWIDFDRVLDAFYHDVGP